MKHLKVNISVPIDFEKNLMQDGRNMAAILKNLKISLSSLIMVRFAPFFRQNAQIIKRIKGRTSDLWNLARSREKTRSRFCNRFKNLQIPLSSLILVRFAPFFRQNAQNWREINLEPQICEISRDLAKKRDRDFGFVLKTLKYLYLP